MIKLKACSCEKERYDGEKIGKNWGSRNKF